MVKIRNKTRANMALTYSPPNPKYFLLRHETVMTQSWDSHETVMRQSGYSHYTVMRQSWDSLRLYSSCRPCRHVCSCLLIEMVSQSFRLTSGHGIKKKHFLLTCLLDSVGKGWQTLTQGSLKKFKISCSPCLEAGKADWVYFMKIGQFLFCGKLFKETPWKTGFNAK